MPSPASQLRRDRLRLLALCEEFFLANISGPYARQTYQMFKALVTDTARYLSLSQDEIGKVSYAERIRDRFSNRRRRRTTVARYIRRQLEIAVDQLPDTYLAELQHFIFAQLFDAAQFIQIVTGQAIREAYDQRFGGCSCMTGHSYVDFYAINPDKVALVKYDSGKQARALLWTTDQDVRVLDRIYPTDNGPHMALIAGWARAQGFRIAYQDDCSDLTVTMRHEHKFPYVDNFYFARFIDNNHIVLGTTNATGDLELQATDGGIYDENRTHCYECNMSIDIDDSYGFDGNDYCHSCWQEYFFCCFECENDYSRSEGVFIIAHAAYLCPDCAARSAVRCAICNDHTLTADAVVRDDGNYDCENCHARGANREAV